jgi:hypothetical protein
VRDRIIAELPLLTDPRTGRRLIKRVWRREERFSGPYVEHLPDLLVEAEYPDLFRPRGRYRGLEPVRHLTVEQMQRRRVTGCHRSEGIFLARGAGIRAGAALPPVEITDVAPTALYLLGEPIPDWMDGRVLAEILKPTVAETTAQSRARCEASRRGGEAVTTNACTVSGSVPVSDTPDAETVEYDDEEARLVAARLKGLGYL